MKLVKRVQLDTNERHAVRQAHDAFPKDLDKHVGDDTGPAREIIISKVFKNRHTHDDLDSMRHAVQRLRTFATHAPDQAWSDSDHRTKTLDTLNAADTILGDALRLIAD